MPLNRFVKLKRVKRFFKSENTKKEIASPDIASIYNHHMGGVDLQDSLLDLYPIKLKSRKGYQRIFYHMLDVVIVNSWLLDRRIKSQLGQNDRIVSLLSFKTELADLCSRGIPKDHKVGRPCNSIAQTPAKRKCIERRPTTLNLVVKS